MASGSKRPKIGIYLPTGGEGMMGGDNPRWPDLLAMAERAEEIGVDSIAVLDHFLHHHWECWTTLSALAACTSDIELVSYVTCTGYRNPALLARMADTFEEISAHRLILGLGAGDSETEHRVYGYPLDHQVSRFEEALQIITALLRDGRIDDFQGRFYQIEAHEVAPRGSRPGGPPILVGSLGGPRMLRLAVTYADIYTIPSLLTNNTVEGLREQVTVIDEACERQGRDPATLEKMADIIVEFPGGRASTWSDMQPITGDPAGIADIFQAITDLGISRLQVWVEPNNLHGLDQFGEVIEEFRGR